MDAVFSLTLNTVRVRNLLTRHDLHLKKVCMVQMDYYPCGPEVEEFFLELTADLYVVVGSNPLVIISL